MAHIMTYFTTYEYLSSSNMMIIFAELKQKINL